MHQNNKEVSAILDVSEAPGLLNNLTLLFVNFKAALISIWILTIHMWTPQCTEILINNNNISIIVNQKENNLLITTEELLWQLKLLSC